MRLPTGAEVDQPKLHDFISHEHRSEPVMDFEPRQEISPIRLYMIQTELNQFWEPKKFSEAPPPNGWLAEPFTIASYCLAISNELPSQFQQEEAQQQLRDTLTRYRWRLLDNIDDPSSENGLLTISYYVEYKLIEKLVYPDQFQRLNSDEYSTVYLLHDKASLEDLESIRRLATCRLIVPGLPWERDLTANPQILDVDQLRNEYEKLFTDPNRFFQGVHLVAHWLILFPHRRQEIASILEDWPIWYRHWQQMKDSFNVGTLLDVAASLRIISHNVDVTDTEITFKPLPGQSVQGTSDRLPEVLHF